MKHYFIYIIIFLNSSYSYSQDGLYPVVFCMNEFREFNEYYEKQGFWAEWTLEEVCIGNYISGKKYGSWIYFDDNNVLSKIRFYESDSLKSELCFVEPNYIKFTKIDTFYIRNQLNVSGFSWEIGDSTENKSDGVDLSNRDFFEFFPEAESVSMGYNIMNGISFWIGRDMGSVGTTVSLKISNGDRRYVVMNFTQVNDRKRSILKEIYEVKENLINGRRFLFDSINTRAVAVLEYKQGMLNGDCSVWNEKQKKYISFELINGKLKNHLERRDIQTVQKYFYKHRKFLFVKNELYFPWGKLFAWPLSWRYESGIEKGIKGTLSNERQYKKAVLGQGDWVDIYGNVNM